MHVAAILTYGVQTLLFNIDTRSSRRTTRLHYTGTSKLRLPNGQRQSGSVL